MTVFVSTDGKQKFAIVANCAAAFSADGFRAGNIIFYVVVREKEEITLQEMREVSWFSAQEECLKQAEKLLRKARMRQLVTLEINPSYGATCRILTESVKVLLQHEWRKL